jgi:mono/diheme cytochrome c family protein
MQNMYEQPRYDTLEPSSLFPDGRSSRTPPPGTIATRTGRLAEASGGLRGQWVPIGDDTGVVVPLLARAAAPSGDGNGLTVPSAIPLALTRDIYQRGQERFEIFCAPCHSVVGDGDGMVVRRGFPSPPTYHSDRLRNAPDQHFFNVITHGYGAMYSYADRIPPNDRWAIVAYIRALQTSQHAPVKLLFDEDRKHLLEDAGDNDG